MTLHVNEVEALWVLVTVAGFLLSFVALIDASTGFHLAKADDTASHEARELTASGNVRREFLRLVVSGLLLSIAIPALFSDRPVMLTPVLVALILVPVVMLLSTVADARDRGRLAGLLVTLVKVERDELAREASVQSVAGSVQEVRALVEKDIETTAAMFEVANHTNEKIAAIHEELGHKEDKP